MAHVLIQMKCCLFPVILSSFHRCGRRNYIRAIKMFDRNPSMLYAMINKSLIHCWDNFEQNAEMLAACWRLISKITSSEPEIIKKMSLSVQRSVVESFNFNGKNIRVVHTKNMGQCFVGIDVSKAVGYNDDDNTSWTFWTHVPGKYRMRLGDARNILEEGGQYWPC